MRCIILSLHYNPWYNLYSFTIGLNICIRIDILENYDEMKSLPISIFPIESNPYGLSYGDWSVRWWKWLLSIPKSDNPALDNTGNKATLNQHDPNVFFLCQTIDTNKSASRIIPARKVTVKSDTSILMPIINWISVLHEDGETDEILSSVAVAKMDVVSRLEVTINGVRLNRGLDRYRVKSPFFDMMLPEDNVLNLPSGSRRFVSDGYWLFLTSLEENTKISTFGSCSSGANKFLVDYYITIQWDKSK
jgi:hypothetical protein